MDRSSASASPGLAVACFARAPSAPGKTRLAAHIPEPRLRALRGALLIDTLAAIGDVADAVRFIFYTPADRKGEVASLAGEGFALVAQRDGDLGERMDAAFDELLMRRRFAAAIVIGSDVPLLTAAHVEEARRLLDAHDAVLGPADDGGYWLIGLRAIAPALFRGIAWSTPGVLEDTLRAAGDLGLRTAMAGRLYDIDTIDDVHRLERDLASAPRTTAPAARAWLRHTSRSS